MGGAPTAAMPSPAADFWQIPHLAQLTLFYADQPTLAVLARTCSSTWEVAVGYIYASIDYNQLESILGRAEDAARNTVVRGAVHHLARAQTWNGTPLRFTDLIERFPNLRTLATSRFTFSWINTRGGPPSARQVVESGSLNIQDCHHNDWNSTTLGRDLSERSALAEARRFFGTPDAVTAAPERLRLTYDWVTVDDSLPAWRAALSKPGATLPRMLEYPRLNTDVMRRVTGAIRPLASVSPLKRIALWAHPDENYAGDHGLDHMLDKHALWRMIGSMAGLTRTLYLFGCYKWGSGHHDVKRVYENRHTIRKFRSFEFDVAVDSKNHRDRFDTVKISKFKDRPIPTSASGRPVELVCHAWDYCEYLHASVDFTTDRILSRTGWIRTIAKLMLAVGGPAGDYKIRYHLDLESPAARRDSLQHIEDTLTKQLKREMALIVERYRSQRPKGYARLEKQEMQA